MLVNLLSANMDAVFYGVIIFAGLLSMLVKFKAGKYLAFTSEVLVFWLVFQLHGGSMTGGFAATVASLLAGIFFPFLLRRW